VGFEKVGEAAVEAAVEEEMIKVGAEAEAEAVAVAVVAVHVKYSDAVMKEVVVDMKVGSVGTYREADTQRETLNLDALVAIMTQEAVSMSGEAVDEKGEVADMSREAEGMVREAVGICSMKEESLIVEKEEDTATEAVELRVTAGGHNHGDLHQAAVVAAVVVASDVKRPMRFRKEEQHAK